MSFKPSVSTDGGATFNENALAFATIKVSKELTCLPTPKND